jgi:6-phosphogluconolactonase
MSEREIIVLDSAEEAYVRAAEEITHVAGEAICTHAEFLFCLAGGSTPEKVYELMATRFRLSIDWKEVQFFFGDERCVPPDDAASNFAMANRTMLSKLELRPAQIHRIRGENPPERAAELYEQELRQCFGLADGEFPRFDLILLGLGENRHTASLFPGGPAIHEHERLAVAVEVDDQHRSRVTLTPAVLNNAERVMFLVTGEGKAAAVKDVIEGGTSVEQAPARIVAPEDGVTLWILDRAAASLLSR